MKDTDLPFFLTKKSKNHSSIIDHCTNLRDFRSRLSITDNLIEVVEKLSNGILITWYILI